MRCRSRSACEAWQKSPLCYYFPMTTLIPAICKGDTLTLRKPLDLPDGTPVMVAVFNDEEREAWLRAGDKRFAPAFGAEEIQMSDEEWDRFALMAFDEAAYGQNEPDYGMADLKEVFTK